jgi:PKD repeat protein
MIRTLSFLIVCTLFFLTSCKNDTNSGSVDLSALEVDFTVNGIDLEKFGYEYTEDEYRMNPDDPDRTYFVTVNKPFKIEDASTGASGYSRTWKIDGDIYKMESKLDEYKTLEAVFEIPGPYTMTLYIDEINFATKHFKAVEGDAAGLEYEGESGAGESGGIADLIKDADDIEDEPMKEETKPVEKPRTKSTSRPATNTSNTNTNISNTKPDEKVTPPAKPEIRSVDFRMAKYEVLEGESFQLQDISAPEAAIDKRIWDFGDGTSIPTNGKFVKYAYSSPGSYSIRLCLNYSDKCETKSIVVKAKPVEKKEVVVEKKKEDKKIEKPSIKEVKLSLPETGYVGSPIKITDESQPVDAITSRAWTINGAPFNSMQQSISKVFEKAGSYTIKICLNGDKTKCTSNTIVIKDTAPITKPKDNVATAASEEFLCQSYARTGLRTMHRCMDAEPIFFDGTAEIVLKPSARMELQTLKAFGSTAGTIKVNLKSSDGKIDETLTNVALPGPFSIGLSDMAVTLKPGLTYTLSVTTLENTKIENASHCDPKPQEDGRLDITYKNNVYTLFDLRYCY